MLFDTLYDNGAVRRQDRLLPAAEAEALLRGGEYGFLAMQAEEGGGYGVPVSYVWDGAARIYLHCAPEGRKLRALERHPEVTFCVVGATKVVGSKFTTAYESLIARCRAVVGPDEEERREALELLLRKYSPEDVELGRTYAARSFHRTQIIRLEILALSGKCKRVGDWPKPRKSVKTENNT